MLTKLEVSKYRGFDSYNMEGLARVNLFVGKNNSGKTALLEGIQYLTSGGDPSVLSEVAVRRGEFASARAEVNARLVDVAHFFNGHQAVQGCNVTLSCDNGYMPVGLSIFTHNRDESAEPNIYPGLASGTYLKTTRGGRSDREQHVYPLVRGVGVDFEAGPRNNRRTAVGYARLPAERQVRFVGTESLDTIELATMWDDITRAGREADVASAMRVLDDKLESVHFLTGMFVSGYFPARGGVIAAFKGESTRVPLGSLGDGMRRMLGLAAALAFTQEGCLFVDEIDTGLHYSVMTDMWKLVVERARQSDIQVFATTHSWDCIEGLAKFCTANPEMTQHVAIHKIDRRIHHSVVIPGERIPGMVKADIDPR